MSMKITDFQTQKVTELREITRSNWHEGAGEIIDFNKGNYTLTSGNMNML